jgi:hypothetical protein
VTAAMAPAPIPRRPADSAFVDAVVVDAVVVDADLDQLSTE